jgi:hypothetical protein
VSLPTYSRIYGHFANFMELPDEKVRLEQENRAVDCDKCIHKRGPGIESLTQELGIDRRKQEHNAGKCGGNGFEAQIEPDTHGLMVARAKCLSQGISNAPPPHQ